MADPKEQLEALKRQEATTGRTGAIPNARKRDLLEPKADATTKNPGKHLRWCNITNQMIMANHELKGYTRVPPDRGGEQKGNLALFAIDEDRYRANVEAERQKREARLALYEKDYDKEAEKIARYLRDEHGLRVSAKSLTDV